MNTDAKVVPLKPADALRATSKPLPAALQTLRDKALLHLREALQPLFDAADDALFGMADRATSNREQSALFEAMRGVRLKRKQVERQFLQGLLTAFAVLAQPRPPRASVDEPVSGDSLSLVHNDQLEESVAVDAMVGKVRGRCAVPLALLRTRLESLCGRAIELAELPLAPAPLCELFLRSCAELDVDIQVRLIILKLFERHLLDDLDAFYAQCNEQLAADGVLPELRHIRAPRRDPARRAPAASARTASDLDMGLAGLQVLLAEARSASGRTSEASVDAAPVSSQDLLRLLSLLQARQPQQGEAGELRDQLQGLLGRASAQSGRPRVVAEVDDSVIDLVSMLFEFILDERNLPDALKALIGRLQIPMIKVALLDRAFFARSTHPARRLLNEIASASLGWGEQDEFSRGSLYRKVESIVQRVHSEFVDDPRLFELLLEDFLDFASEERRRSELLEQRTRDAEEGRARAEQARAQVRELLMQRVRAQPLPQPVLRLLGQAWSKVLLLTWLKHGEASAEWTQAVGCMDTLIWSVAPIADEEQRQALLQRLPELLEGLREGLASAAVDAFASAEYLRQMEALHLEALRQAPASEPLVQPEDSETLSQALAEVAEPAPALPPEAVDLCEESLRRVEALGVGSWLEISRDGQRLRCKLAAVMRPAGRYVFVNRTGMKALELSAAELAALFRDAAARVLDDALLFDRALESVIGSLRRARSQGPRA